MTEVNTPNENTDTVSTLLIEEEAPCERNSIIDCPFCLTVACAENVFENCVLQVANDNINPDDYIIHVPSDETLGRPSVVRRMAVSYAALGISRYRIANFVNDQVWEFAGEVFDANGRYIELLLLDADDVFGSDADPSERWLGEFLSNASNLPKQQAQGRVLPRLRLLWIALAIASRRLGADVIR